ncbi:MAG: Threonine synthase, partial [uncultured Solirubrobacterales bacterium]
EPLALSRPPARRAARHPRRGRHTADPGAAPVGAHRRGRVAQVR